MKMRFPILDCMPSYPYEVQVKIVVACCVLHNIIRIEAGEDQFYEDYALKERILDRLAYSTIDTTWEAPSTQDKERAGEARMDIAEAMFEDYRNAPAARRRL